MNMPQNWKIGEAEGLDLAAGVSKILSEIPDNDQERKTLAICCLAVAGNLIADRAGSEADALSGIASAFMGMQMLIKDRFQ